MSWPERSRFEGMARRQVGRNDLIAHSLAVLTPSLSALGTGLALPSMVGPGFWISTILGFGLALLLAGVLSEFTQRFSSGGSLYTFAAKGLAPAAALLVGVAMLLGYSVLVGAGVTGAVRRSEFAWYAFGGADVGGGPALVAVMIVSAVCMTIMAAGISVASRSALIIEAVSITVLIAVLAALVWRFGTPHWAALSLDGASPTRIAVGAALIATLTVAFESSAALGLEAGRPLRDIPSAMGGGLLLSGGLFVTANAVGTVLPASMSIWSFRWFGGVDQAVSPLDGIVLMAQAASYLALAFCAWNAVARVIFSLAREGVLPRALGRTTPRGVPWPAIVVVLPAVVGPPIVRWMSGESPSTISWGMLRVATEIICVAYGLTALALLSFLSRIDESRPSTTLMAVVSMAGVLGVLAERIITEATDDRSTTLIWLSVIVGVAVAWRIVIAGRLMRHRAVLGAHDETLASDVLAPDAQEGLRGDL